MEKSQQSDTMERARTSGAGIRTRDELYRMLEEKTLMYDKESLLRDRQRSTLPATPHTHEEEKGLA